MLKERTAEEIKKFELEMQEIPELSFGFIGLLSLVFAVTVAWCLDDWTSIEESTGLFQWTLIALAASLFAIFSCLPLWKITYPGYKVIYSLLYGSAVTAGLVPWATGEEAWAAVVTIACVFPIMGFVSQVAFEYYYQRLEDNEYIQDNYDDMPPIPEWTAAYIDRIEIQLLDVAAKGEECEIMLSRRFGGSTLTSSTFNDNVSKCVKHVSDACERASEYCFISQYEDKAIQRSIEDLLESNDKVIDSLFSLADALRKDEVEVFVKLGEEVKSPLDDLVKALPNYPNHK